MPITGRRLEVTVLDVGCGDSILIEANDGKKSQFALVDSNDTVNAPSSRIFLKRHFQRLKYHPIPYPMFTQVFATHAHDDHVNGIQGILKTFGTNDFYHSACNNRKSATLANTLRWAKTATRNNIQVAQNIQVLAKGDMLNLGPVKIDVLWPPHLVGAPFDRTEENNNSLVLQVALDDVCILLTGDCLAKNWDTSKGDHVVVPADTCAAQLPHHGAVNGMFDSKNNTPMLDQILTLNTARQKAGKNPIVMCLSSHIRPHHHPRQQVIDELDRKNVTFRRTDQHYHMTFRTDGTNVEISYSHT